MEAFVAGLDTGPFGAFVIVLGGLALMGFGFGLLALRRARRIEDLPTSRIRSAAQGYVELDGYARLLPGPAILAPLSQRRCCWWRYAVYQRRRDPDSGQTRWERIESGESDELFLLADATGECIVDPEGAEVTPAVTERWSGPVRHPMASPGGGKWYGFGDYRYVESRVEVGNPLYATGWFRTQAAVVEMDEARDLRELLAEWKQDRGRLLRRFDADRNGEIDLEEWEAVRRAALEEVRRDHVERAADPSLHVLCSPGSRGRYQLSTRSQAQIVARQRIAGWLALGMGILAASVALSALMSRV